MTTFELTGMRKQYSSTTKAEAEKRFNESCTLCVCRPGNRMCKTCPIAAAHECIMATMKVQDTIDMMNKKILGLA